VAVKKEPSKIYEFKLLKKNEIWKRLDFYPPFVTAYLLYHNFGSKIFDREQLVPVLSLMLACTVHSLMFFVNFWSADINVFFAYKKLSIDSIETASHVWVSLENKKQQTKKTFVVPRLSRGVEITPGN